MIVNGMLVPPPNMGDALFPDEPGYQVSVAADNGAVIDYLTAEQRQTLREAGRVESCARQQILLLNTAHIMVQSVNKLARDFVELSATGKIRFEVLVNSMSEIESASAKMFVALQELRYQANILPEHDGIGHVLRDVNFHINNKRRALDWDKREQNRRDEKNV